MKISIIATSHRKNSESKRVSKIFNKFILEVNSSIKCFNLDMFELSIPLWTSERDERNIFWNTDFTRT